MLLPWLSWPVAAGALVYLIWILLRQPEVNIGHRAGAKGFQGEPALALALALRIAHGLHKRPQALTPYLFPEV